MPSTLRAALRLAVNAALLHFWEIIVTDKPGSANHSEFSARLQVLHLVGEAFVLVFDQWDGPALPPDASKQIKEQAGARGVLFFRGDIEIGDC